MMRGDLGRALFARVAVAANVRSRLILFLGRRDDEIGDRHVVLVRPCNFLPIGVTAAVVPALIR